MEHNRCEGTHNHPGYQTQTAHPPLQSSIIVEVVSQRHRHPPRNRLSHRFINKATTAKLLQGDEENL
jgi:hypothetical protein